jgi:transcriptional regulator with XRE-family HTH domain
MSPDEDLSGRHIRDFRHSRGMTQLDLARQLGVHPSTVQKWEASDRVRPHGPVRRALEKMLCEPERAPETRADPEPPLEASLDDVKELAALLRDHARREMEARLDEEARDALSVWRTFDETNREVVERFLRELSRRHAGGFSGRARAGIVEVLLAELERSIDRSGNPG